MSQFSHTKCHKCGKCTFNGLRGRASHWTRNNLKRIGSSCLNFQELIVHDISDYFSGYVAVKSRTFLWHVFEIRANSTYSNFMVTTCETGFWQAVDDTYDFERLIIVHESHSLLSFVSSLWTRTSWHNLISIKLNRFSSLQLMKLMN